MKNLFRNIGTKFTNAIVAPPKASPVEALLNEFGPPPSPQPPAAEPPALSAGQLTAGVAEGSPSARDLGDHADVLRLKVRPNSLPFVRKILREGVNPEDLKGNDKWEFEAWRRIFRRYGGFVDDG